MSNKVNINRYTPYKQRLFGDLQHFLKCERSMTKQSESRCRRRRWSPRDCVPASPLGPVWLEWGSAAAPRGTVWEPLRRRRWSLRDRVPASLQGRVGLACGPVMLGGCPARSESASTQALQQRLAASCLCITAGCSHSALNFSLLYSLWYLWSVVFEVTVVIVWGVTHHTYMKPPTTRNAAFHCSAGQQFSHLSPVLWASLSLGTQQYWTQAERVPTRVPTYPTGRRRCAPPSLNLSLETTVLSEEGTSKDKTGLELGLLHRTARLGMERTGA